MLVALAMSCAVAQAQAASLQGPPRERVSGHVQIAQANVWPQPQAGSVESKSPAGASPVKPAKPAPRPAVQPAHGAAAIPAPADTGNLSPPQNPEPVLHAKNAKLGACLSAVERGAASVIDGPHSAFSNWNPGAPSQHAFEAIAVQAYQGAAAPRSASVLLATPAATGCDASTVQIFPSARSCADIEKDFARSSRLLGKLAGLPLYGTDSNEHRMLLPSAGNGCVIIAVHVQYVAPAAPVTAPPTPGPAAATK